MVKTPYIEFHTQKRIEAEKIKTKMEKKLYKLMNNAIYDKIIKNWRNRISVKLANNKKDYLKSKSKSSNMSHKIFNNDLVAMRKSKLALKLGKPAYIGICILYLSIVLMYKFHYSYVKIKYDGNWKLSFTDTDSLMYETKTEDIYEDFTNDKNNDWFQ